MRKNYGDSIQQWDVDQAGKIINSFRKTEEGQCLNILEFDDLRQDCLIAWMEKRKKYKHKKASLATYMDRVITNKLRNIIEEISAKKRQPFFNRVFLDELLQDKKAACRLLGGILKNKYNTADVVLKSELISIFSKAIQKVTSRQKIICELIMEGLGITEISRKLKVKVDRKTVYNELKCIRKVFIEEGIKDWLEKN